MIHLKNKEYQCPVELALDLIGGKWKPLILWYLREEPLRFSQLKKAMPNITQKMLTQQLRELEQDGLVNRFIYTQVPPKVEYSLTEIGQSLSPILVPLCQWGQEYANRFGLLETETSCPNTLRASEGN